MPNATDAPLREPLSLVPNELWLHAALMALGAGALLPCGAVMARRRSLSHRYMQALAVGIVVMAAFAALTSEWFTDSRNEGPRDHGDNDADDPHRRRKRHLAPLVDGTSHAHASTHAFVGLALVATLVGQVAIGCCGASVAARGADEPLLRRVHRWVGRVVVVVVVPLQIGSGVAALFQLCSPELSGVDQCVGHNGVGAALLGAAAAYWHWAARPGVASMAAARRDYGAAIVEQSAALVAGLVTVLYSLYSEWPYGEHPNGVHHLAAGIVLSALTGSSLYVVERRRSTTLAMPRIVVRGLSVALTAFVGGSLMFAHHQMSDYGRVLHVLFGVTLYAVAVARVTRRFKTLAYLLVVAAFQFMASQRGFQVLYMHFYAERFPLGAVVLVLWLAATLLYVGATMCARAAERSRDETSSSSSHHTDTASVDDVLQFGGASADDNDDVRDVYLNKTTSRAIEKLLAADEDESV